MTRVQEPARNPCGSCPYRRDVPSGVWAVEEYEKLRGYDEPETFAQPMGLFLCHQADGRVCAGWAACHDMDENLALRLAAEDIGMDVYLAVLDYRTDVPLWGSGNEAADHGEAEVETPGEKAGRTVDKILRKRARR